MKWILFLVLFCYLGNATAQQSLSEAPYHSAGQAVYRLTNKEALKLFKTTIDYPDELEYTRAVIRQEVFSVDKDMLHNLVRTCPASEQVEDSLPPGHYIIVTSTGQNVHYHYVDIPSAYATLLNNDKELLVVVSDKDDKLLSHALVYLNNRNIPYNEKNKCYLLPKPPKTGILRVWYQDVMNYQFVWDSRKNNYNGRYYNNYYDSRWQYWWHRFGQTYNPMPAVRKFLAKFKTHKKEYGQFMVISKPKYKPGDTLKLKAFLFRGNGQPLNEPMKVHLSQYRRGTDTVLATIQPYRPGGYDFSFVLTDSLHLQLDNSADISLEPVTPIKGKRSFPSKTFSYQDYELTEEQFKIRAGEPSLKYYRGLPIKIYLKATDRNDLPVLDAQVKVKVSTSSSGDYSPGVTYIPDVLWETTIPLESLGETVLTLPDSIFPDADLTFSVKCTLETSNFTQVEQFLSIKRTKEPGIFRFREDADSLDITYETAGKSHPVEGYLNIYNSAIDTSINRSMHFPCKIARSPFAKTYTASTDSVSTEKKIEAGGQNISATGGILNDTLRIHLNNPDKIPVWYQLAAGKKIIDRGYGTDYSRISSTNPKKIYKLMLQYISGSEAKEKSFYFIHATHNLNVDINAPAIVQPGEKTRVTINVTDANNKPVKDADVTAYALTSKFQNPTPRMPYFPYYNRKTFQGNRRYEFTEADYASDKAPLNWSEWKSILGLDTMAYFHFFHPDSILYNFEPAVNGITQLAPFVVKNEKVLQPYLIWIDDQLVYIQGTINSSTYSFPVTPGYHKVRIRVADKDVTTDFIYLPANKKTFISINLDNPNSKLHIENTDTTLTNNEKNLIDQKTYLLKTDFSRRMKYLITDTIFNPLPFDSNEKWQLIGPFHSASTSYVIQGDLRQRFEAEGNNSFDVQQGLVKEKEAHISRLYYSDNLRNTWDQPILNSYISDWVILDSLHNDFIETLSVTIKNDDHPGMNKLLVIHDQKTTRKIRQQFLHSYADSSFLVMQGNASSEFTSLRAGYYKLVVLMRNNGYIIHDSILVKDGAQSVYNYAASIILPDNDSMSSLRARLKASLLNDDQGWTFIQEKITPVSLKLSSISTSSTANKYFSDFPAIPKEELISVVTGVVRDKNKIPIAGCIVRIAGTSNNTSTDANGQFTLQVPLKGELLFMFVGFESKTFQISPGNVYNVVLKESETRLQEVVVTALGMKTEKKELTGAVSIVRSAEINIASVHRGSSGSTDTIRLRGIASLSGNSKPLLVIDGVPFNGQVDDLDKSAIVSISILEKEAAINLYGSAGANGAIIITTNGNSPVISKSGSNTEEQVSPKNRLRQHFRDDAFWQPRLRTNEDGKATFDVTYPDDLTSWDTYALAITTHKQTGSSNMTTKAFRTIAAALALPHFIVAGDTLDVLSKITNYNQDSLTLQRSLQIDGQARLQGTVSLINTNIATTPATPRNNDSLRVTLEIHNNHLGDGEYRAIPVLPAGTTETTGMFATLRKDSSFTVHPTDTTPVKVFASVSAMPVLFDEVARLRNYKYLCNEQTASRLMALLLQKKWYERLDSTFTGDDLINKLVKMLEQNSNKEGYWGWWKNNETEYWVTAHVLKALHMAAIQGFKSNIDAAVLTRFIAPVLNNYAPTDRLYILDALMTTDPTFNAAPYLDTISITKTSAGARLKLLELKQRAGISVNTAYLLTTVQHTNYGNTFWGDDDHNILGSRMINTLAIYRMLKREGGHDDLLRSTRAWILENRGCNGWLNTWESSNILETIGDDILAENEQEMPALQINSNAITSFPYQQTYPATALQVQKKGNRSIYFAATQEHFITNPVKKDGAFRVSSAFILNDKAVNTLTAGKEVTLQVNVEAMDEGEYVMVEIPIPAGCSFAEKPQEYWFGSESYREYHYDKVNIYCRKLPKGQHQFTVKLLPRYSGHFNVNPAKAEEMYAPVLSGREGLKKVTIQQP